MELPHHLALAVVASVGASATSCAEYGEPPRVTLVTSVTGANCDQNNAEFLTIGSFVQHDGFQTSNAVINEQAAGAETTAVECRVVPQNDAYVVTADAEVVGPDNSQFKLTGTLFAVDQPQGPVSVQFNAHSFFYKPENCVVTYATSQETVAPGTFWAQISCPNVPSLDTTKRVNGRPVACDIVTTARFEECAQR